MVLIKNSKLKIFQKTKVQLLIIALLTFLAYSNTLLNGFVGDDELYINTDEEVKHLENIPRFFSGHEFNDSHTRYRPIGSTYLAFSYQIWGKNPFGYHLQSLLLHLASTLLVYGIARYLTSEVKKMKLHLRGGQYLPFTTALLFGLHPVHTETVNFVFTSIGLGYVFYLASFYLYLLATQKSHPQGVILTGSVLSGIFAVFSYELTISLPLVIIFYGLCFRKTINLKSLIINQAKVCLPYLLIVFAYILSRVYLFHIDSASKYLVDSFYITMLVMIKAFVQYIWLLIFPLNLSIIPPIGPGVHVLMSEFTNLGYLKSLSIFKGEILIRLFLLILILTAAIKSIKKHPLVTFGVGWFFLSLSPVSYIFPQDTAYQERYIYLASFGFCLLLGYLFDKIFNSNFKLKIINLILITCLLSLVTFYGIRTYLRNLDWKDSVTMWNRVVEQYAFDIVQNYVLATHYENSQDESNALKYYNKVLSLEPRIINLYEKVALVYLKQGKVQEARDALNKALLINPGYDGAKQLLNQIKGKQ